MKLKRISDNPYRPSNNDEERRYLIKVYDRGKIAQLNSCQKQVDELVGEIFKEIENITELEKCDPTVQAYFDSYYWIDEEALKALKQKYGVGQK